MTSVKVMKSQCKKPMHYLSVAAICNFTVNCAAACRECPLRECVCTDSLNLQLELGHLVHFIDFSGTKLLLSDPPINSFFTMPNLRM